MSNTEFAKLSLSAVGEVIRKGEVSSEEVTCNCLERLESGHPRLNCVAGMDAEAALDDARKADQVRSSGEALGPLHGVPLAHKDMYYRKGRVSACGSKIRQDFVPEVTSTALEKLDAAGDLTLRDSTWWSLPMVSRDTTRSPEMSATPGIWITSQEVPPVARLLRLPQAWFTAPSVRTRAVRSAFLRHAADSSG